MDAPKLVRHAQSHVGDPLRTSVMALVGALTISSLMLWRAAAMRPAFSYARNTARQGVATPTCDARPRPAKRPPSTTARVHVPGTGEVVPACGDRHEQPLPGGGVEVTYAVCPQPAQ